LVYNVFDCLKNLSNSSTNSYFNDHAYYVNIMELFHQDHFNEGKKCFITPG